MAEYERKRGCLMRGETGFIYVFDGARTSLLGSFAAVCLLATDRRSLSISRFSDLVELFLPMHQGAETKF